jgi:hypothetical protein
MLAGLERVLGHGKVLRVGRADVNGIDRRIAQDLAIIGGNRGDGKARAQASRRLCVSACDGGGFDGLQSAHRFKMHAAHEAGAELIAVLIIFIVPYRAPFASRPTTQRL